MSGSGLHPDRGLNERCSPAHLWTFADQDRRPNRYFWQAQKVYRWAIYINFCKNFLYGGSIKKYAKKKEAYCSPTTVRLIITGKPQSGKTTALQRLSATAHQAPWRHVLNADRATAPADLAVALTSAVDFLHNRDDVAPALIIIDDVQRGARDATHGRKIRDDLTTLFELARADDLLVFSMPRAVGVLPPAARLSIDAELRLLSGYFQLVSEVNNHVGRIDPSAPLQSPPLSYAALYAALHAPISDRPPPPITRYEGPAGSGRTYALYQHPQPPGLRRVYLDCRIHSHKSLLTDCIQQCAAAADERANIATLADAATIALSARPTLLLLDNVEYASAKMIGSLDRLLSASSAAAFSITPPRTIDHTRDPFASLRRRATRIELQALDGDTALMLIRQKAPAIDSASEQTIIQRGSGHAATIAAYAERVQAHGDEERHELESYRQPNQWLVVAVMLFLFIGLIYVQRHLVENDIIAAVGTGIIAVTIWLLRPRFMRLTRPK